MTPLFDRNYTDVDTLSMSKSDMLEILARRYDIYASDQEACVRFTTKVREKANCLLRRDLYNSVAAEVRQLRDQLFEAGE